MNKTISLLILASAALHVLVLGLIDFNSPTNIVIAGSLMRISIQAPSPASVKKVAANKDIAKPLPKKKTAKLKTTPKVKPVQKKITVAKTKPPESTHSEPDVEVANKDTDTSSENDTIVAKLETPSATSASALPEQVSSLLHSDLERAFALHFYYPRIAIKRGWQGEVRISLRIEADGHLSRVRVLNSSGHVLLDKAAIASIDKVEILPTAIALLDGRTLDLILPVEYRLL